MNQKGWTVTELVITIFVVLLLVVCTWSLGSVMKGCSGVADEIQKQGLKSVVERIWEGEGKQNGK